MTTKIGESGVTVDSEVVRFKDVTGNYDLVKSAFRDYIADDTKITDHSEMPHYLKAGTKE